MLPTWFLSMWISNTAATSMMIPIIQAVMTQIREANRIRLEGAKGLHVVMRLNTQSFLKFDYEN